MIIRGTTVKLLMSTLEPAKYIGNCTGDINSIKAEGGGSANEEKISLM